MRLLGFLIFFFPLSIMCRFLLLVLILFSWAYRLTCPLFLHLSVAIFTHWLHFWPLSSVNRRFLFILVANRLLSSSNWLLSRWIRSTAARFFLVLGSIVYSGVWWWFVLLFHVCVVSQFIIFRLNLLLILGVVLLSELILINSSAFNILRLHTRQLLISHIPHIPGILLHTALHSLNLIIIIPLLSDRLFMLTDHITWLVQLLFCLILFLLIIWLLRLFLAYLFGRLLLGLKGSRVEISLLNRFLDLVSVTLTERRSVCCGFWWFLWIFGLLFGFWRLSLCLLLGALEKVIVFFCVLLLFLFFLLFCLLLLVFLISLVFRWRLHQ